MTEMEEELRPCSVCGKPVLWGTRCAPCGRGAMALEAAAPRVLSRIEARMKEHEAAANDPANADSFRRRAMTKYGEAKAIYEIVRDAFGVTEPFDAPLPKATVGQYPHGRRATQRDAGEAEYASWLPCGVPAAHQISGSKNSSTSPDGVSVLDANTKHHQPPMQADGEG